MSMKEITIPEMLILMNSQYQGRHMEIDLSPVQSANTYHWFSVNEIKDMIEFEDLDPDHPQLLKFYKQDIEKILYSEGKNVFESVFTLNMKDLTQIQICVYEEPMHCYRCHKILNLSNDSEVAWEINGFGGYSSHFDGERLDMKVCDDCMYEFVYGCEFVDLECCFGDCEFDKEKDLLN